MCEKIGIFVLVVLLVSCRSEETGSNDKISINIDKVEKESINDWFESIELIPLASIDESWIKDVGKMIKFNDSYYILDDIQRVAFEFDSIGNMVNSTERLNGQGPNEILTLLDFDIDKTNGNWHILDPSYSKIKIYDKEMSYVGSYDVVGELYPLAHFKHLKDDLYFFYCPSRKNGEYAMKLYDAGDKKILNKEMCTVVEEADNLPRTCYSSFYDYDDCIYFTQKYSNNDIYKINLENLGVEKAIQYDFKEHTFNIEEIKSLEKKDLGNYMDVHNKEKAFVLDKCENSQYYIISVYYNQSVYIIKHDKSTKQNRAIVNDDIKKGALPRPILIDNDYYYSVLNPEELINVINEDLLSGQSRLILPKLKEDDNPVIVKYKLKKDNK